MKAPHSSKASLAAQFASLFYGPRRLEISDTALILLSSLFFAVAHNTVFFSKVLQIYPLAGNHALFLSSLFAVLVAVIAIILSLLCYCFTTKPVVIGLLIVSALTNSFMSSYGVIMNTDMLTNILETNPAESLELANTALIAKLFFLGILPSFIIARLKIRYGTFWLNLLRRSILIIGSVAVVALAVLTSAPTYASFLREHKPVRYFANPVSFVYATVKLATAQTKAAGDTELATIADDAKSSPRSRQPKLVIFVVGETARADRFSLNGYDRETNPLLQKEDFVNLSNVSSAGTSTSISVPSMFSHLGREEFSSQQARSTENVLDILQKTGASVLWVDNNSDSKGVALRVPYRDYRNETTADSNDEEPRDEGMLEGLQEYIDQQDGDICIVLHQMGSHGPGYYKRYPKAFEVFKPVCKSSQLEECSQEEIDNAYDNTILYTDYFLSKVIALLKNNDLTHETAMLYFSDHGESLGEDNMYLHGYPYALAPEEQTRVPAIMWFGSEFPVNKDALRRHATTPFSHDNIFHTLLGLFEIQSQQRVPQLDLIAISQAYQLQESPDAITIARDGDASPDHAY